jgi:hypothetical protein
MFKIILGVYLLVGICLAFYWLHKEYHEVYSKTTERGSVEDSMIGIMFVSLAFAWPFKLVYSLIEKR